MRLHERQTELDALGAEVVLVTFESPKRMAGDRWMQGLSWRILYDPDRLTYAAFGLRRATSLRKLADWATIVMCVRGLLRGHPILVPTGDALQLGGYVVVGPDGQTVFTYRSQSPGDAPPPDLILQKCAEALDPISRP